MSKMISDDELLEGESGSDCDYDVTMEEEKVLLEGEDDEAYLKKDVSDDEQDVLDLDAEEDFQDVDEKPSFEQHEQKKIETLSKPVPENTQNNKSNLSDVSSQKVNLPPQNKRQFMPRNNKRRRGINNRTNFQTRPKNNIQRRRNGTVLINPRYEGTVHVDENNARLAWDNSQYTQNNTNYIQPWATGNYEPNNSQVLLKNILTTSLSPGPNFFEPPPPPPPARVSYERQLSFEPPPSIKNPASVAPYTNQMQVPNNEMYLPPPTYEDRDSRHNHLPFNTNQPPIRAHGTSQNYDNYTGYDQQYHNQNNYPYEGNDNSYRNENHRNYINRSVRPNTYNTSYQSTDAHYRKSIYVDDNNQNRYTNYENNDYKQSSNSVNNYSNYESRNNYVRKNSTQEDTNQFSNYRNIKRVESSFPQQNTFYQNNTYRNNNQNIIRRIPSNDYGKNESPEKKMIKKCDNSDNFTSNPVKPAPVEDHDSEKNVCPKNEEQEDEETRRYRLKIEEQKKERERILRLKEERRKQMALEKLKRDEDKLLHVKVEKSETSSTSNNYPAIIHSAAEPNNNSGFMQRTVHNNQSSFSEPYQKPKQYFNLPGSSQKQYIHSTTNPVSQKPSPIPPQKPTNNFSNSSNFDATVDMAKLTFKVSNNLQDNSQFTKNVPKIEASSSNNFMSNRVVLVKNDKNQKTGITQSANENCNEPSNVGQGLSSFLTNRKVLKKDNTLPNTRLVVVHNLSATINQNKLMALTRGIGEIQTLQVDKQERQATILFKSVASAHTFFKKYQRRMLDDLSLIEVRLEPMP